MTFFFKNLENKIIKPMFDCGGSGVLLEPKLEEVLKIKNKENYIIQEKINFKADILAPFENIFG